MIITLTLNPALDKSTEMDKLVAEKKIRCGQLQMEAGGGGINVSKALHELGSESLALFPSGGMNGKRIEMLLERSAIWFHAFSIQEETRESFVATEKSTHHQYRFVMPGPALSARVLEEITMFLTQWTPAPTFLICSGSLPPGVPDHFLAQLSRLAKSRGIRFLVDTSGAPLQHAVHEGVYLIKPNLSELCSLVGKEYLELSEINEAARQVMDRSGCEAVVVSMGNAGALLVTATRSKRFIAPDVKKLSTVGAGDSMVAGMAFMLERGEGMEEAVRFGVACGTAATMNKGTQLFKKDEAFRLYNWMRSMEAT